MRRALHGPAVEPNDRKPRWCYLGKPETANTGPVGIGRFSTLRAWLSQWSIDDSNADGPRCARSISVPLLAIENSADDAVPQPHARIIHDAAASRDKTFHVIKGATHYYQGQPELLQQAVDLCRMDGEAASARLRGGFMRKLAAALALFAASVFSQETIKIGVITDASALEAVFGAATEGILRRRRDQPQAACWAARSSS